jgi:hypothetical protein
VPRVASLGNEPIEETVAVKVMLAPVVIALLDTSNNVVVSLCASGVSGTVADRLAAWIESPG